MGRTQYLFSIIFSGLMLSALAQEPTDNPDVRIEGLSHPESVIFDDQNNLIYVSNIGDKEEGDGFISKLSEDGKVLELKWITGLNDPKGLLLNDGKLFVTDVTEFVEMDPEEGHIIRKVKVDGAKSLNDVTADASGNIFISDLANNKIFERDIDGDISEWMHSTELQQPNGLYAEEDKIYISAWGKDSPGNLLVVDRQSHKVRTITNRGIGNLDGLQRVDSDSFYASDWNSGKIYRINKNGNQQEVLTSAKSSGDILFLNSKQELWLPMNKQNAVWIYSVAE